MCVSAACDSLVLGVAFASPSLRPALVQQLRRLEMLASFEETDELKPSTPPGEVSDYSREDDEPPRQRALLGCSRPLAYPLRCSSGLSQVDEDSEDDEDSRIMNAIQHPRWFDAIFTLSSVQVKIHGLVTPLGRQLNGCLGTIVRVDTAAKRYVVKVDNFGLKSIKPENLELIIEPLNRANSRG